MDMDKILIIIWLLFLFVFVGRIIYEISMALHSTYPKINPRWGRIFLMFFVWSIVFYILLHLNIIITFTWH